MRVRAFRLKTWSAGKASAHSKARARVDPGLGSGGRTGACGVRAHSDAAIKPPVKSRLRRLALIATIVGAKMPPHNMIMTTEKK